MTKKVEDFMRVYAGWLIRNRTIVVAVIGVITVLMAVFASKIRLENNLDHWLPQDHPFIKTTRQLEKVFGGRNYMLIGIVPKQGDIYRPEILAKVRTIQKGIERMPEAIRRNVISMAARKAKAIRGTEDGLEARRLLDRVPQTQKEIDALRDAVERNPVYIKAIVAPDGKAAAVLADFKLDKENAHYGPLYDAVRKIVDAERDDTVDIHLAGLPVDLRWLETYNMQMRYYFVIALFIIIAIQYWSFRTLQGMFLPIVTAILSVIWALGIMGLQGESMSILNTNTPILIMAVTAGHAIQILKRYYEEYRRLAAQGGGTSDGQSLNNAAIVESIVRVGPVMILAGIIAVMVFYSLKLSNTEMTRRFGELAASGILAGLITELTFIPTIRSFLPPPKWIAVEKESRASLLDRLLTALSHALIGRKAVVLFGCTLGAIVLIFSGVYSLRMDATLKGYFGGDTEVRTDDAALNKLFGGTNSMIFLVEGKGEGTLKEPSVLRGMERLQQFLATQPHVGKTQSLADLIKRMNAAMHEEDPAYNVIPDNRDLIAQYLLLYSLSGDPQDFDNVVDNDYRRGAVWVFVKTDSTKYAHELYRKAEKVIAEAFPPGVSVSLGGSLPQNIASNEVIVREKIENMLQMGIILFFLSSAVLRSFVGGCFVVTPLVMVIMANFGIMGWLGIPLDTGTALSAALAIAIGADYELYLMFRLKEELAQSEDLPAALQISFLTAGKAVILAALSVAGGYSVLLTSSFGFYQRFGIIVIATMVVSAVSTVVLLRSMMMIFKPKFVFGRNRDDLFRQIETSPGPECYGKGAVQ